MTRFGEGARTVRARAVRWAFHSKRNMRLAMLGSVVMLIVATAAVSVAATLAGGGESSRADAPRTFRPNIDGPFTDARPTEGEDAHAHESRAPQTEEQRARARTLGFAREWTNTSARATWYARVSAYCAPSLASVLESTDLAKLPKGGPVNVQTLKMEPFSASTRVLMSDGFSLDVELAWDGAEWQVTSYEPTPSGTRS